MSKPTNNSLIGAFILGAVALLIGSIVAFSSFSFNKKTYSFVTYITDSINGLSPNSDVKFRGVKIGSVKEIKLALNNDKNVDTTNISIPVIIELDGKFVSNDFTMTASEIQEGLDVAIKKGLRSRIQQANVLTGILYIEIDFFPGTPVIFREKGELGLPEIPSTPSNLTQMVNSVSTILSNLAEINFKEIAYQLQSTAKKLDEGLGAIEFKKINDNIVGATDSANKILSDPELSAAVKNMNELVANIDVLSKKLYTNIDPVSQEFRTTATSLRSTLDEINKTATIFQNIAQSRQGSLSQDLSNALEQIDDAARAVRTLAEYLQRNPNSVLTGKPESKEK